MKKQAYGISPLCLRQSLAAEKQSRQKKNTLSRTMRPIGNSCILFPVGHLLYMRKRHPYIPLSCCPAVRNALNDELFIQPSQAQIYAQRLPDQNPMGFGNSQFTYPCLAHILQYRQYRSPVCGIADQAYMYSHYHFCAVCPIDRS